jgi:hypothetical protein
MKKGKPGLRGIDNVVRNINLEIKKMEVKSLAGMLIGAAIIRRDMDMTPPLIPIDTGNLRASWFTTSGYKAGRPFVQMGFTASYALFVHEMEWKQGKRPGSGPKFFEASVERNKDAVLLAIATSCKI